MSKNLYRVTCKGMTSRIANGAAHGVAYVVADSSDEAYKKVRKSLEERRLGMSKDRALDRVELIAEQGDYPECGHSLYA